MTHAAPKDPLQQKTPSVGEEKNCHSYENTLKLQKTPGAFLTLRLSSQKTKKKKKQEAPANQTNTHSSSLITSFAPLQNTYMFL